MNQHEPIISRVKLLLGLNSLVAVGLISLLLLNFVQQDVSDKESSLPHIENLTYPQNYDEPAGSLADQSLTTEVDYSRSEATSLDNESPTRGRIALVIDDLGYSSTSTTVLGLMDLPIPLTVGIIPSLAATSAIAEIAEERGYEILVHVPMEAIGEREDVESVLLHSGMGLAEFQEFMSVVKQVPHATGLSNHQGSAATQDAELMRNVALWCSHRGWLILDSITHPGSVLYSQALDHDVLAFKRDLFLDHNPEADSIRARLYDAERLAYRRDGLVVIIGHPRASTLDVLRKEIPRLMEHGIEFVRLRDTSSQKTPLAVRGER